MSIVAVHGPTMLGRASLPADADTSDLASLVADSTYGDGNYTGAAFGPGQYLVLDDGMRVTWDGSNWTVVN